MKYKKFSQLWNEIIGKPNAKSTGPITGMTQSTCNALIAYGQGDKSKIFEIRNLLSQRHEN